MWWTKEEVQKWSLEAQKQAGYVLDVPFLGHCDEVNPIDLFRASTKGETEVSDRPVVIQE